MTTVDPKLLSQVRYRCIGPSRGGRVVAVAADPVRKNVFYFGAVAGGVWKSDDAGQYWENITDGFLNTASIGALAVAPSDGNVIYAGTGETTIRLDVTHGDGVYKSTDAGVTWQHIGLTETRHIGEIRVHPDDPDLVYVAALGHASQGQPRARAVPLDRRWRDLGARAARQRAGRCGRRRRSIRTIRASCSPRSGRPGARSGRSTRVGPTAASGARWTAATRGRTSAPTRVCPTARSARSACRSRRRGRVGCSRSSRPRAASAACTAPTTTARRGRRSRRSPSCSGVPGTTCTSSPTPPMPTRCT